MSTRARQFHRAIRAEVDLEAAAAVIVVDSDGALTLLGSPGLDRPALAQALVSLAFALRPPAPVDFVPSPRGSATNHL